VEKQKERTNHESTKGPLVNGIKRFNWASENTKKSNINFVVSKFRVFVMKKNSNLTQNSRLRSNIRIGQLVADGLTQIWNGFGLAFDHVAAVVSPGRHILINPVIALHQFRKSEIPQLAVSFGAADIDTGYDFMYLTGTFRAFCEGLILD
jgi:hypothetical protein